MLRILSRDSAAQVACTHFLEIPDLASLHAACRTWRHWVEHPPTSALESIQRKILIQAEGVQQLALCGWARLYFTTIAVDIDDDERVGDALSGTERMRQRNRALFSRCCFSIAQFPRLKQLHVEVCSIQIHEPSMALAFTALGSSLTYLSFDAWGMDVFSAANSMLRFTPLLKRLETLEMGSIDEGGHGLDLSPIRSMQCLKEVSYGVEANAATHRWTAAQVAALSAIRSLQVLENSCWSPLLDEAAMMEVAAQQHHQQSQQIEGVPGASASAASTMADEGVPTSDTPFSLGHYNNTTFDGASLASDEELIHIQPLGSPEQQIEQGIATLVRGQVSRARAGVAERARKRAEASLPPLNPPEPIIPVLQKLSLSGTVMSAPVWTHVSQLVGLTSLAPMHWRADIGARQTPSDVAGAPALGAGVGGWARLGAFRSLLQLDVRPAFAEVYTASASGLTPIRTEHFLPVVLRLPSLTSLALGPDLDLSVSQLRDLGLALPGLTTLVLRNVGLEDPKALGNLVGLQALTLEYCYGIGAGGGSAGATAGATASPAAPAASSSAALRVASREIQFRTELPPFPRLCRLVLYDRVRLSEPLADKLNPLMFSRMPALTLGTLTQNLLAPVEVYAPQQPPNKQAKKQQHA